MAAGLAARNAPSPNSMLAQRHRSRCAPCVRSTFASVYNVLVSTRRPAGMDESSGEAIASTSHETQDLLMIG